METLNRKADIIMKIPKTRPARGVPTPAPLAAATPVPAATPGLPLPHERDQAARGQVAPQPDPVIVQALHDLEAGMVDTDMRQTPGLDAQRRRRMVPTPTVPGDRKR